MKLFGDRSPGEQTDSKGSYFHQQVVRSNDVTPERALDYQLRQHPDTPTDHKKHGKADHEAPTRRHPSTLVASRIRNETSAISMESDEGDDRRWTYEGPA